jgi:uncharacterized membrane protein
LSVFIVAVSAYQILDFQCWMRSAATAVFQPVLPEILPDHSIAAADACHCHIAPLIRTLLALFRAHPVCGCTAIQSIRVRIQRSIGRLPRALVISLEPP